MEPPSAPHVRPVVHVIDDEGAVRESLSLLLSLNGYDARAYESASAFLAADAGSGGLCGCVVTNVRMPGVGGVELLARLKESGAALPAIVMTGHGDIPLAVEAMKRGAADFLEKPFEAEALLAAVRSALASSDAAAAAEARLTRKKLAALTPRENEILAELAAGKQNRAIAEHLSISVRTVEVHRASIMAKMDAKNVSQLIRMVLTANR
jgi:two-component system response regulator FixJ